MFQDPEGLSNELFCEAGSFSHHCNPHGFFQSEVLWLFSCTGTLGCAVCLDPQLFLPVYLHTNVGPPTPPATTSLGPPVTTLQSVLSTPPTGLDECFSFNSLVVGLPYSLIFWQFWLFFVLKFIVVLVFIVQGGTVYLPTPLSWLEIMLRFHYMF